ncbi:MAG: phosphotransferase [Aggregatilineales bacterium]
MLEKPALQDAKIIACLRDQYGLQVAQFAFLPIGDWNTAVYRVVTHDKTLYFLKLRRGVFDETSVMVPQFLSDQGIVQVIVPILTRIQQLWTSLDTFSLILYPFVEGRNGFERNLSDRQWGDFGRALKGIHTAIASPALLRRFQQETYSPQWREIVRAFQVRVENDTFDDPIAANLAAFMKVKRDVILDLVGRAERLSLALQNHPLEFVLCHSDIHAGNILIDANYDLYIVDWDNPILAPQERDLMFIGGGVGGVWHKPEEENLFYQGYGQTQIDPIALAYYRYERIVEDIAAFCEQILLSDDGAEDREKGLRWFISQFLPNNVVEIAYKSQVPIDLKINR